MELVHARYPDAAQQLDKLGLAPGASVPRLLCRQPSWGERQGMGVEASAGSFKWRHVIPVESLTTRKRRGCAPSFAAAELCCCRALLLPSVAASRIHCRHLLSYPVLRCCVHIYIHIYTYIYIYNPAHRVSRPRGTGSVGDSVGEGVGVVGVSVFFGVHMVCRGVRAKVVGRPLRPLYAVSSPDQR